MAQLTGHVAASGTSFLTSRTDATGRWLAKDWLRTDSMNPAESVPTALKRHLVTLRSRRIPRPPHKVNMSPTQTSQVADLEPGQLLNELEQRQDDVLEQLDALDTQLQEVLRGLGVTLEDELDEDLV